MPQVLHYHELHSLEGFPSFDAVALGHEVAGARHASYYWIRFAGLGGIPKGIGVRPVAEIAGKGEFIDSYHSLALFPIGNSGLLRRTFWIHHYGGGGSITSGGPAASGWAVEAAADIAKQV